MSRAEEAGSVDHLAEWQAVDDALRRRQVVYGVASREQAAGKSGLEMFKAMIAGELPAPPISKTLDFILVEAEHGRVVFQGRPGVAHYNPMGMVHGGWSRRCSTPRSAAPSRPPCRQGRPTRRPS